MINHVMVGTNDIEKSESFYTAILGVLGADAPWQNKNSDGQNRLFYMHDRSIFCVTEPINGEKATVANGGTIGFACKSPEQVKEFHDVAVANGATSVEDPPGPRETSTGTLHLCYFLDPDGHKICGAYRPR